MGFDDMHFVVLNDDPQGPGIGSNAALTELAKAKHQTRVRKEKITFIVDTIKSGKDIYGKRTLYSDYIEESYQTADQVFAILNGNADDKLGRIDDLFDSTLEIFARWLVDSGNDSVTIPLKKRLGVL